MAAPNNPRFITVVMDLGFRSNPNLHRAQKRPIQSADRSTATVGGVGQSFSRRTWFEADPECSVTETKKTMMMENARTVRRSVDANEQARERAKTTPLRNEAQLNCVSLRSQLDCEVTCGAVKGQDERPLRGALDSPASHHRTSMLTSENKLRRGGPWGPCWGTFS